MTLNRRKFVSVGALSLLICTVAMLAFTPRQSSAEGSTLPHRAMIPQLASDSATGVIVIPAATATPKVTPTPQATPYVPPPAPPPAPGGYRY